MGTFRIITSVVSSLINSLSTRGGANRDDCDPLDRRLTARLRSFGSPFIAALAIIVLLGVLPAILPQSSAHAAAAAYLADEIGNTEISVDVDEEFSVVLWLTDVSNLAGYDCAITISGPATAIDTALHGSWFAGGHTIFDGATATATFRSGMLTSPTQISGSGDLVVFTLRGDDDGVVAININQTVWCLADTYAEDIEVTTPSTLYVTVGTGESLQGGGEQGMTQELLLDPVTWYVDDDATNDPGPGDPEVSDPLEDGTESHPFDGIQEALDPAYEHDIIIVEDGTYIGEDNWYLWISSSWVTIRARNPYDPLTGNGAVIDCDPDDYEPAFVPPVQGGVFTNNGYDKLTIEGFKIINASADNGGAICILGGSDTTIVNNWFESCTADSGGAIYTSNASSVTIEDNDIVGCSATTSSGGGIRASNTSVEITNNRITSCSAEGSGGAISVSSYPQGHSCQIIGNTIGGIGEGNTAGSTVSGGNGGGICATGSGETRIEGNTFTYNSASRPSLGTQDGDGGAIYVYGRRPTTIAENTINNNSAAGDRWRDLDL